MRPPLIRLVSMSRRLCTRLDSSHGVSAPLSSGSVVVMRGCCPATGFGWVMCVSTQGFPAEHCILLRWLMIFTSPVVYLMSWVISVFFVFLETIQYISTIWQPYPVLTSPLVYVCAVLWPGCSPYGSGDMENLSLSGRLYQCQALLFLLRPFPSPPSLPSENSPCWAVRLYSHLPHSLHPSLHPPIIFLCHTLSYAFPVF